jgi:hypothetical protein
LPRCRPFLCRKPCGQYFRSSCIGENRFRPRVVVSRIVDKLAVERELGVIGHGRGVIGLEYLLGPGIWQLAVADDPA